jgi:5-methylcytosine-specific restriction endonuclease McrA
MDEQTRHQVRQRAGHRCEYCQLTEAQSPVAKLQIEHIMPKKHGGSDDLANLALACIDCNLRKGANLTGIDPDTGQVIELFNPRSQRWAEHFAWNGCHVVGLSAIGRTTIRVLDINSEDRIRVRIAST